MPWVDPIERTTDDAVTAALWNQDVVENGIALKAEIDAMGPIAETVLTGPAAYIEFASIPATFRHLLLLLTLQNNGGTGNHYIAVNGSSPSLVMLRNTSVITAAGEVGRVNTGTGQLTMLVYFPWYWVSTALYRGFAVFGYGDGNASVGGGTYNSANAITTLRTTPQTGNYIAGSKAAIYGIP